MKKLSYLLGLFLVAGFMFSSCSDDEDTTPQDLTPTITFKTGGDFTSANVIISQGDSILVGVMCSYNSTSKKNLERFKLYMIVNDTPQTPIIDSLDINNSTFDIQGWITYPAVLNGKLFAEITDKDGQKNSQSFDVTVEASAGPIHTYTAILMGGQTNPDAGSFYSTGEDQVYEVTDLTNNVNNQKKIDLVFFYGTTNQYSLGAPDDDQVFIAHELNGIGDWTNQNSTVFSANAITGLTWADVTDDGLILSNASNLTESLTNSLANDQIYAFETASTSTNPGKKGLFKVIETMGTSGVDRAIKIEVKIKSNYPFIKATK